MSKAATTTAAMLALLTGLVLGQIGTSIAHSGAFGVTAANSSPRALETATAFYEGLNRLVESGDRSIESTVAPGFVEHTLSGQEDRTLQQMIDVWLALGSTFPHLRLHVIDLQQRDRHITVRLEIDPGAPTSEYGVSLGAPSPHQVLEVLRVEGAGITERWEAIGQLPVVTFSMETEVRWNSGSVVVPAVQHVVLAPGRSTKLPYFENIILRAESGSVLLDRAGEGSDGTRRPVREPLEAGQVRVLDGNDAVTLRNVASVPAELWAFSANSSVPVSAAPGQPRFVALIPLPLSSEMRAIPQRLTIVRISLPSGATIAAPASDIIETVVLDGALHVSVDYGRALVLRDGRTPQPFDDSVTITAGQGMSAKGTASLSYRATGSLPTTILMMRIDSPQPTTSTS